MTQKKRTIIYGVTLILVGLIIGLVISSNFNLHLNGYSEESNISSEAINILSKTGQAMAEVAAAVKPAVVNISSTKTIKIPGMQSPFFRRSPFQKIFWR